MILSLLREKPRTMEELMKLCGVSKTIIRTTLNDLSRSGYMEVVPKTYRPTAKGMEQTKPEIDWLAYRASQPKAVAIARQNGIVEAAINANRGSALFNLGRSQL